ncbi:MAG: S-adenosylmethionine:tRNA ribosyltransferase-isomerase [Synergistales bacterium 58_81]|jgi:S-adenosylmethionine:tRNA ribosyltransferase-isomerase|nr:MAG: S-adenosylmethionine:tRNA ribosyltransferase-isomerase [Synergistales bacterium 57_84]KUK89097.1 MAG: S-adenosylmethionine:tRNA ribosyltransferase-isomerase [Synergistales bacterium 58_81]
MEGPFRTDLPGREGDMEGSGSMFDINSYDYYLPESMIAQEPAEPRDSSKLLVLDRFSGTIRHRVFHEIMSLLREKDLLVINDTRVARARLRGVKIGGGASIEVFLLRPLHGDRCALWEVLVRPGRRVRPGQRLVLDGGIEVVIGEMTVHGSRTCSFPEGTDVWKLMEETGEIPFPPYIHNPFIDPERYQTVYGVNRGSVAAPTAGLHFSPELLRNIEGAGIRTARITLNVGLGTFRPVKEEDIRMHRMHSEECTVPEATALAVKETKDFGGRVVAVGTTVVRALESRAAEDGTVTPGSFSTEAFFYPGYRFRTIDAMITNFHLPRSTLLMLVCAFAGNELIMKAYSEAIESGYRFYSFGDAMFIQ